LIPDQRKSFTQLFAIAGKKREKDGKAFTGYWCNHQAKIQKNILSVQKILNIKIEPTAFSRAQIQGCHQAKKCC